MKLVSHLYQGKETLAFYIDGKLYNTHQIHQELPQTMQDYLDQKDHYHPLMLNNLNDLISRPERISWMAFEEAELLSPLPKPQSFRDAYAFRQHVEAGRRNRNLDMIPEFDQFPVFYFSNPNVFAANGPLELMPDHFERLDYELEIAIIIGKKGKNILAADADEYIAGYMILNDWSARQLQMEEMTLNLGPAKGKDFITTAGPILVTPESLKSYEVDPQPGHIGKAYDLEMIAKVNGKERSRGNFKDMHWTFAEIIERCSYGVELIPGDVIGSGTVGTGCLLELNGTLLRNNPKAKAEWLKDKDEVSMEITELGELKNTVHKSNTKHSLFDLKK